MRKKFVVHQLLICSENSKTAFKVNFTNGINIILWKNSSGKSALMRSIFYPMDININNSKSSKWAKETLLTVILSFEINNNIYFLIRESGKETVLYNKTTNLMIFRGDASKFYNDFNKIIELNAKFSFKNGDENDLRLVRPEFAMHPFVLEQDEGWNYSHNASFDLKKYKLDLKDIMLYHFNIKGQDYFDLLSKKLNNVAECEKLETQKRLLLSMIDSLKNDKYDTGFSLDNEEFKADIESLTNQVNLLLNEQNNFKNKIISLNNEKTTIEIKLNNLKKINASTVIKIHEYQSGDNFHCNECGESVSFNVFLENIETQRDIELITRKLQERIIEIDKLILEQDESLKNAKTLQENALRILSIKKNDIDFNTICKRIGIGQLLHLREHDLTECEIKISNFKNNIKEIQKEMKTLLSNDKKDEILNFYISNFKQYSNILDNEKTETTIVDDVKLKNFSISHFKNTFTGSRIPKNFLAHFFASLDCIYKYSNTTLFPIIIDTPKRNGTDNPSTDTMIDFIIQKTYEYSSQSILLTEELNSSFQSRSDINIITLNDILLLKANLYNDIKKDIENIQNIINYV